MSSISETMPPQVKNPHEVVQAHPHLTIRPPSELTSDSWQIELLTSGKIWKVPPIFVSVLLEAAQPLSKGQLASRLGENLGLAQLATTIDQLMNLGMLVSHGWEPRHASVNYKLWEQAGAPAAGDYHIATLDFPFMDYSPGGTGWQKARDRMFKYARTKPDNDRFKTSYSYLSFEQLDPPGKANASLQDTFEMKVKALLSLSAMQTGEKIVPWSEFPLIRRTSPSGGSRHPTEVYYLAANGELFHCNSKSNVLGKIGDVDPRAICEELQHKESGCVFLTCVFERNSYRYREPRTFRSVHMDAGHIAGTIEMVAASLGLQAQDLNAIDENALNVALGIDGYNEFLMSALYLRTQL